jgi:hypothetical protein
MRGRRALHTRIVTSEISLTEKNDTGGDSAA